MEVISHRKQNSFGGCVWKRASKEKDKCGEKGGMGGDRWEPLQSLRSDLGSVIGKQSLVYPEQQFPTQYNLRQVSVT